MNKLVLPISVVVLVVIFVVAFNMKKTCVCVNGKCSKCNGFSFDHFFNKKEKFTSTAGEVPGFYTINTTFPTLTNKKNSTAYWV